MNDILALLIDNYPRIDGSFLYTEYDINPEEEISISINNSNIFGKDDIVGIHENRIEFPKDVIFTKKDSIVVIYNRL